ncbi:MAG: ClpXP protease specificity-enhancing factor [Woeseiaceae bacterium]|nr:ClpXP protease specificity-enhancing factor [Woeseiaceae bacterium]
MSESSRSKRPYLIRAMHEWMADNGHTPHIVVDAAADNVDVPSEHVKGGRIILNISESAAHNLALGNDSISFRARFGGVPFDVWVPTKAVLGIYARETGQGMIFSQDSSNPAEQNVERDETVAVAKPQSRPHLKLVK